MKSDSFSKDFTTTWNGVLEGTACGTQHGNLLRRDGSSPCLKQALGMVQFHPAQPPGPSCPSPPLAGFWFKRSFAGLWFLVCTRPCCIFALKLGVQYTEFYPEPIWRAQMRPKHSGPLWSLSAPSSGACEERASPSSVWDREVSNLLVLGKEKVLH